MKKKTKLLVSIVLTINAATVIAQTQSPELCGPDGAMEQERQRSIGEQQKAIDQDPFFEQISKQRGSDRDCMLDLSRQLGGAVGSDTQGLGTLVDQIFKQVGDSICQMQQGSVNYGGATPSYSPDSISRAANSALPAPAPSVIGPSSVSKSGDVWSRLSDAMTGRPSN